MDLIAEIWTDLAALAAIVGVLVMATVMLRRLER
jgi:hypothetical protein